MAIKIDRTVCKVIAFHAAGTGLIPSTTYKLKQHHESSFSEKPKASPEVPQDVPQIKINKTNIDHRILELEGAL